MSKQFLIFKQNQICPMAWVGRVQGIHRVLVYSTEKRCMASFHTVSEIEPTKPNNEFVSIHHRVKMALICFELTCITDLIIH